MSTFVQLQTDLRPPVIDLLSKGPKRFQEIYDHVARYVPGYQPIHFQAEILGWIMRSQVFVIYNQKSEPFITHMNPAGPQGRSLII